MADTPLVTVLGEALIDLVADDTGAYFARPGGSPYNVAIGLARLGIRTSLMARLADNAFGRQLRRHAEASGVDLSVAPVALEPTTLAVVSLDEAGQAAYDFYLEGTADWQWTAAETAGLPGDTAVLHFGSIASWTAPGCERIHARAQDARSAGSVLVSYDPNVRPLLLGDPARGRDLVEPDVAIAHVVKASSEDLGWLYPDAGIEPVAASWLGLGARLVVVTHGAEGATAYQPDGSAVHRPGRATRVVDTVGAGDAFTAGLLAALVERSLHTPDRLARLTADALAALLDAAALVSSLTGERVGADPPTAAERDAG